MIQVNVIPDVDHKIKVFYICDKSVSFGYTFCDKRLHQLESVQIMAHSVTLPVHSQDKILNL